MQQQATTENRTRGSGESDPDKSVLASGLRHGLKRKFDHTPEVKPLLVYQRRKAQDADARVMEKDSAAADSTSSRTRGVKPARIHLRRKAQAAVADHILGDEGEGSGDHGREEVSKVPAKLGDLLATGLLEGIPVKYVFPNRKRASLHGIICGTKILCFCSSCKRDKAISPCQFEKHAGSHKRTILDCVHLNNGNSFRDILKECASASPSTLHAVIERMVGKPSSKGTSTRLSKSEKNNSVEKESPGIRNNADPKPTRRHQGLHKLFLQWSGLLNGTRIGYYANGKELLVGYLEGCGIRCNCCDDVVSPSTFEDHAGQGVKRKPYHNIYLPEGVSLHELSVALSKREIIPSDATDNVCYVCGVGGALSLCNHCPRVFHQDCLPSKIPEGFWSCPYCVAIHEKAASFAKSKNAIAAGRVVGANPVEDILKRMFSTAEGSPLGCPLCKLSNNSKGSSSSTSTVVCNQCARLYHFGCLKEHKIVQDVPKGKWFCCIDCLHVNNHLEEALQVGMQPILQSDIDAIKKKHEQKGLDMDASLELRWRLLCGRIRSKDSKRLFSQAIAIFHESFDKIVDERTQLDLIPEMVHGRKAKDYDYSGMYCAVLTNGSNVMSVGLLRVRGCEFVELPLVATREDSQGLGYFQSLFACVERLMTSLKVKHFVLPSAHETKAMWIKKYGFSEISPRQSAYTVQFWIFIYWRN